MGKTKSADSLSWTSVMEEKLVDALLHQSRIGNRVGGTFTTTAYGEVVSELLQIFPDKPIDKEKVKNRMKYMKRMFTPYYDIFKNCTSGFSWSSLTGLWSAEHEVWEALISAHPEAAEWRDKPYKLYDKLSELWAIDRAGGDMAENAREMRGARRKASEALTQDTIDVIDDMIARNEATLEGYNSPTPNNNNERDNLPNDEERGTKSSAQKKGKTSKDAIDMEFVKGMSRIAEAIESSAAEYVKSNRRYPIPEGEIWTHLVALGIEQRNITNAYLFLIEKPDKLRALLGVLLEMQKDIHLTMMKN